MERFAGVAIQAEKEVLAIVASHREREAIMESINREHGPRTPAGAMVISLPIDYTARLD